MQNLDDRIKEIEEEIRKTPYHKGTEHHIGKLKARIAKLREEQVEKAFKSKGSSVGGYAIKKTGNATVVLVGPPSVGKSTLLNQITNADSKVAAYDFTTLDVIPGMLDFHGAKIQIFDVPGIVSGAASGKGRGKEVLAVARGADLIAIMVDVKTTGLIPQILKELYEAGFRLNQSPPAVSIIKQSSGGIKVNATTKLTLSYETIKSLANEFRLTNAEIIIKEDVSLDHLVDAFMANRVYLPCLIIINKIDLGVPNDLHKYLPQEIESVEISSEIPALPAGRGENLERLKEKIWEKLNFIRLYLKNGEMVDKDDPLIAKKGQTLLEILENIAISGKESFKSAEIFGPGAKYPGQEVSLRFIPQDETVIQFLP